MNNSQRIQLAREAMQRKASARRYAVTWRSNAACENYSGVAGFTALAARLGLSERSLRCYLSTGKGQHSRPAVNPLSNELDILTVTQHDPPAKPKRPRGRPRKHWDASRLGEPSNG